ncbi:MAG: phenylalanine--tRNA ligase subunit beta [Bacteroidales bacterium]|jgi:phenylalanyl-tRNA synthetase beta chain|nr:phenylalanine--tRNA ligase subunit beta [Bacteroidales bacterium]
MKISYNWLKQYANITQTPEELSILLTDCGLEVESVEYVESIRGGLKGVVVGEVMTCEKHPDADKLNVTTVNVGQPDLLHIVCGAPNVAAGQKVPVATIGTMIYKGDEAFEIKKSKLRGQPSEGMICAADELGLGDDHDGIMVLATSTPVGTLAADYFKIETDAVFEIGLTPNRNDATSHIGVARDVIAAINAKALGNAKLSYPDLSQFKVDNTNRPIQVMVENADDCPRYSGLTISDIQVKESPEWLKNRLKAVGLRPINNIVDVTNFVLMEYGQPLHAFDVAKISGQQVIVKKLSNGTLFKTLDGVERKLNGSELMICNANEGMCIAGVFGGEKSGVSEQTTAIFLESAYFNPVSIRKTSKLHGLKTDASFRYERGADPNITIDALKRAALLIKEVAGGTVSSEIVDVYPTEIAPKTVAFSYENMNRLLGNDIPKEAVLNILQSLEIGVNGEFPNLNLEIPTNKADVYREVDVIEEILRIYGFNRISNAGTTQMSFSHSSKPDREKAYNLIADFLTHNGFAEIMNNSLTKAEHSEKVNGFDANLNVTIANALSNELDVMRQSLLFGGLSSVAYNCNHQLTDLKFYEFGTVYQKNTTAEADAPVTKKYKENQRLAIFVSGNKRSENWQRPLEKVDFNYLKSVVNTLFSKLRLEHFKVEKTVPAYFSEGLTYNLNGKPVAAFGKLSKSTLKYFDIKQEVYFADIAWNDLLKAMPKKPVVYKEIAKQPEVRRDLALLVDKHITFSEIEAIAFNTEKNLLQSVNLFDVYEGDNLPDGKKSYAVSFILQDAEKTLDEKRISNVMEKMMKQMGDKLGAVIR